MGTWDSLGEYLALNVAFQDLAAWNPKAKVLSHSLEKAVGLFLTSNRNPSAKTMEIDNRGSHYWLARYWAEELAKQDADAGLKATFTKVARDCRNSEAEILKDLIHCQGKPMDLGGYYRVDKVKADALMNPSAAFNNIINRLQG